MENKKGFCLSAYEKFKIISFHEELDFKIIKLLMSESNTSKYIKVLLVSFIHSIVYVLFIH